MVKKRFLGTYINKNENTGHAAYKSKWRFLRVLSS